MPLRVPDAVVLPRPPGIAAVRLPKEVQESTLEATYCCKLQTIRPVLKAARAMALAREPVKPRPAL